MIRPVTKCRMGAPAMEPGVGGDLWKDVSGSGPEEQRGRARPVGSCLACAPACGCLPRMGSNLTIENQLKLPSKDTVQTWTLAQVAGGWLDRLMRADGRAPACSVARVPGLLRPGRAEARGRSPPSPVTHVPPRALGDSETRQEAQPIRADTPLKNKNPTPTGTCHAVWARRTLPACSRCVCPDQWVWLLPQAGGHTGFLLSVATCLFRTGRGDPANIWRQKGGQGQQRTTHPTTQTAGPEVRVRGTQGAHTTWGTGNLLC